MATSHAPLRAEAPEEGFEGQGYDISREILDGIDPISRPRLREKAPAGRGEGRTSDVQEVDRLHKKITLVPEAPRDKTQQGIDKAVVARHDSLYQQQVKLDSEMRARLVRAEVAYDQYERAIENPGLVTRKEVLSEGEPPFRVLVRRYKELEEQLGAERQKYALACFRLRLTVEDVPSRSKGKVRSSEHLRENLSQVHDALARLAERLLVKQEPLTLPKAGEIHQAAVKALHSLELPPAEQPLSEGLRSRLLRIQFLYKQLEAPIDELRVGLLREIEEVALEVRLAEERGEVDKERVYRQQLRQLIEHTGNLFSLGDVQDPEAATAARERYHLVHAWYRKLKAWMLDGTIDQAPETVAYVDNLQPEVERSRRFAYHEGLVLGALPLEVYSKPTEH
ncbi:hypothetical protein KBD34_04545 [Patescibacteria group bacterium]|nr:hypothetical protein [Patescibacteria group bacterium]